MKLNKIVFSIILFICSGMELSAQCGTAYISADKTVVCIPKIVRFKVNKFPAGTTFEWDFGGGYVSSDSTFTKLYAVAGNSNVRVKLKYLDGTTCVIDKVNFIQAKAIPVPMYTVSKNVVCGYNDSITITDITPKSVKRDWLIESTFYNDGPKVQKAMFGGPSGYKGFTIFMKDSFGCEGRKSFDSAVFVPDSISVDFSTKQLTGCAPKLLEFANNTDTLGYPIAAWNWQFPGGANPASSNLFAPKNILYNLKDTFDVTLCVTTKRGCTYQKTRPNYLMFADSLVLNTTFSKTSMCGNEFLTVTLNNGRSGNPTINVSPQNFTRTIITPNKHQFKFSNFGNYSFYISDEINGCKSEKTYTNQILVNGPIAGFQIPNSYSCLKPDTFNIIDTSKINIGLTKSLKWDLYFDSVLTTSLQSATTNPAKLICNEYASYAVRQIVTGSNGCKDTLLKRSALYIKKILPRFIWKPQPACPIEMMEFENATARGTSKAANKYLWTFYKLPSGIFKTDTLLNPKISYPDTGRYSVKLLVYNNLGCRDSITLTKKILIERPIPKFNISDSNVCFNQNIGLSARYKDSNYYKTYEHRWLFQHKDSTKIIYSVKGDTVSVSLLPGIYTVRYTRYSIRNTCFDTIKLPFRLKVSGVNYIPGINPIKVCNPYNATLYAMPTYSYNYKNNSTTPTTSVWQSRYDTNSVVIRKPLTNPTDVFIKKSGYFYFKFKYAHASGCNDSVYTNTMTSGVVASFVTGNSRNAACTDRRLNLYNKSDKDAVRYKWFLKDSGSGAVFYPSDTSKNPYVVFKNEGTFRIGLVANGNGSCTDTTIQYIYSSNVRARFSSDDTLNYCAPIIAKISATKYPAIYEYRWYLGDGDSVTNNITEFGHLYSQNTGPDGSDVRLVVKSYGCFDTLDKKGYIKVIGPIPKFYLTNNIGCEKLKVNFINQSRYYRRFFLEYGDGSVLDSINFNTYTYQIFDRSLPYQKFTPTLSVIDTFGCIVQYKKDTIFVLKSPEPKFTTTNQDTGCADLQVQFRNNSIGGVSFKWDFDGNGTIESTSFAPKYTYPPGDFNPILIATAANGCQDTARNMVFVKAYKRPEVKFTASTDSICYNGRVQFVANSLPSNTDIKSWEWDFGDPASLTDTAFTRVTGYNFKRIGLSQVLLLVKDKNNCTDTTDKFIYTNDTIGPVSAPMNYVTVSNNQFIDVNWGKSNFKYFTGYRLFNDNAPNYTLLYSGPNRNDTTFRVNSGIDVSASRYCYVVKTKDQCNNLGAVSFPHCTIFLQVTDTAINDLILDWLPYEGWGIGNVRRYRIYRSEAGGPFKLIDSTVSVTSYRDRKLCNKLYCYYIEALDRSGKWTSKSNTVCKTSLYISPSVPVNSVRTTVLPGNKTYTQWRKYSYIKNVDHYVISRSYTGSGTNSNYTVSDSTGYIDDDKFMETNRSSYTYTIRAVDHCGAESPESQVNTTILLKGKSEGYVAKLNWTKYDKWYSGVKQYQILLRENNTFKLIGSIDTASSLYQFDFLDTKLDDSICFKIQAIKDTSEFVESFSNTLCLISEAKVFVPNAFTPNGDTKNEIFIPRAILIFNQTGNPILDYKLEIYNRWGEQVFFSNDVNVGWDGTYKGTPCQEGHYVYKVRALSLDGVSSFNLEGIFVLLR